MEKEIKYPTISSVTNLKDDSVSVEFDNGYFLDKDIISTDNQDGQCFMVKSREGKLHNLLLIKSNDKEKIENRWIEFGRLYIVVTHLFEEYENRQAPYFISY